MTDYLQTNTFKPVNWTWNISSFASGPVKHTIAFKDKVITRPDLPNPTEDDDCQLVLDRYWSDSDQHNTFTATPNSVKIKADDTKGKLFLCSNSIDLEQGAIGDKEAREIHFYGDRMHLGTIYGGGGKDIKYADIVTKDQLPTAPTNYVTTDTVQTITGKKTFTNSLTVNSYINATAIHGSAYVNAPYVQGGYLRAINFLNGDGFFVNTADTDYELELYANGFKIVDAENGDNNAPYLIGLPKDDGIIALTKNIPAKTSQLTNDSAFITSSALTGYATETWVGEQGYQNASDVSTAVSTAISGQTKETWTFTLADGSTVTKSVVLG